jgi:capsular exopolysaccharide synthesis family protein
MTRPGRSDPVAAFEDAYQVLRAELSAALSDSKQPRVMMTSPGAGEGRTIACVNLALCSARAGQRVVVVDLDLRHPDAHRLLGAHNDFGLSDLLLERRPPEECVQHLQLPGTDRAAGGVYFVGTGPPAGNPAELLAMDRTSKVLDLIGEQADLMLIDTPPLLSVADALIVGRLVSGALLVAQAHRTTRPDLGRAKSVLDRNLVPVLGVVLNRSDPRDHGYRAPELPG